MLRYSLVLIFFFNQFLWETLVKLISFLVSNVTMFNYVPIIFYLKIIVHFLLGWYQNFTNLRIYLILKLNSTKLREFLWINKTCLFWLLYLLVWLNGNASRMMFVVCILSSNSKCLKNFYDFQSVILYYNNTYLSIVWSPFKYSLHLINYLSMAMVLFACLDWMQDTQYSLLPIVFFYKIYIILSKWYILYNILNAIAY